MILLNRSVILIGKTTIVLFIISIMPFLSFADDELNQYTWFDGRLRSRLSVGYLSATANEYVLVGGDYADVTLSHLIWDIKSARTIEIRGEMDLSDRWVIYGAGTTASHQRGFMANYDYLYHSPIWTHRSRTPDTRLDRYHALDFGGRYTILVTPRTATTIGLGLRSINFQMTSYGGDYVYSSCDEATKLEECFRSTIGVDHNHQRGITYGQALLAGFMELGISRTVGEFKFELMGLAGVTVSSRDRDMHWDRGILFTERFAASPYGAVSAAVSTAVSDAVQLVAFARLEKFFKARGDMAVQYLENGLSEDFPDGAAYSFSSLNIGLGARIQF